MSFLSHDIRGHSFSSAVLTKSALVLHDELASAGRLVSGLHILEIVFDLKAGLVSNRASANVAA